MREPQVVRMPLVQKMSLCATGMPVSGPASPAFPLPARRSSATRACARLTSSSTVMKAFSLPLSPLIRSRKRRVSSTDEIFLAARAADSSDTVELITYSITFGTRYSPSSTAGATAW